MTVGVGRVGRLLVTCYRILLHVTVNENSGGGEVHLTAMDFPTVIDDMIY